MGGAVEDTPELCAAATKVEEDDPSGLVIATNRLKKSQGTGTHEILQGTQPEENRTARSAY